MSLGILYYSKQCRHSIQLLQALQRHPQKNDIYYIPIDRRRVLANGAVYVMLDNGQEVILPPHIKQVPAYVSFPHGGKVLLGGDIMEVLFPRTAMPAHPTAAMMGGGGSSMSGMGGRGGGMGGTAGGVGMGGGAMRESSAPVYRPVPPGMSGGGAAIGFSSGHGRPAPSMSAAAAASASSSGGTSWGGGAMRAAPPQMSEPSAFSFGDHASMSDSFSFLDQSADDLKATGNGGMRQLHGFTSIHNSYDGINTPPEDYVPNKVGTDVSLDKLREAREMDVPRKPGPYSSL